MKRALFYCVVIISLAFAIVSCWSKIPAGQQKVEDDLRETIFLKQLKDLPEGTEEDLVYFIRIYRNEKETDPSDEFMVRLKNRQPKLKKYSQCYIDSSKGRAVFDKDTNQKGAILTVEEIKWLSNNKVDVSWSYYRAGKWGKRASEVYELRDNKWVFVETIRAWVF